MRRRRRRLKPLLPTTYITLAEVKEKGLRITFDVLAPADKQRIAEETIGRIDELPRAIRHAIKAAKNDFYFMYREDSLSTPERVNFTDFAVKLLDKGMNEAQIITHIHRMDALATKHEREQGLLPPAEGRA